MIPSSRIDMSEEPPADGWFRQRGEAAGDVFFVLRTQPERNFAFVSDTVEAVLGVSAADLRADAGLIGRLIDARDAQLLADAVSLPAGRNKHLELRWVRPDGGAVWTEVVLSTVRHEDGSVTIEGSAHDITSLRGAERALAESEQKYRLLAENAWDVVWTMEVDGTISYVSPSVERVRGITPEQAMAQTLDEIHPPESVAKVGAYFSELSTAIAAGTIPPRYHGEHEYYRKDGSLMLGELDVIPQVGMDGKVIRILGVTRDISERREFEEELKRMAVTDPLTGVCNRRQGERMFRSDLAEAGRYGFPLSVLVLDIDHFKKINDTLGHEAGDLVLVELTARLTANLRTSDLLARWGGEEFVVIMRHCCLADALTLGEKLRRLVAESSFPGVGTVTVSIGAAQLRSEDNLATLFRRADRAMYAAKISGRNSVRAEI
jgi:diguanylate cyclase (GGDEF)-like protein/PAS domain S-box-containing protein